MTPRTAEQRHEMRRRMQVARDMSLDSRGIVHDLIREFGESPDLLNLVDFMDVSVKAQEDIIRALDGAGVPS